MGLAFQAPAEAVVTGARRNGALDIRQERRKLTSRLLGVAFIGKNDVIKQQYDLKANSF